MTVYGLFTGQSNATGSEAVGGPFTIDPRVMVWNNAGNSSTGTRGNLWVRPDRNADPFEDGGNNQGIHAAHHVARILDVQSRVVITGRNGQSINHWHNGVAVGDMYQFTLEALDASGQRAVDWFGWNHGSADEKSYTSYRSRWDAFLAQMEADGIITASTPIFISETAHAPLINGVLEAIANDDPRVGYVRMGSYPTVDGAHFTGPAMAYAGYESVRALSTVPGQFHGLIPPGNYMPLASGFAGSRR